VYEIPEDDADVYPTLTDRSVWEISPSPKNDRDRNAREGMITKDSNERSPDKRKKLEMDVKTKTDKTKEENDYHFNPHESDDWVHCVVYKIHATLRVLSIKYMQLYE
jgi:hypothetical protein